MAGDSAAPLVDVVLVNAGAAQVQPPAVQVEHAAAGVELPDPEADAIGADPPGRGVGVHRSPLPLQLQVAGHAEPVEGGSPGLPEAAARGMVTRVTSRRRPPAGTVSGRVLMRWSSFWPREAQDQGHVAVLGGEVPQASCAPPLARARRAGGRGGGPGRAPRPPCPRGARTPRAARPPEFHQPPDPKPLKAAGRQWVRSVRVRSVDTRTTRLLRPFLRPFEVQLEREVAR